MASARTLLAKGVDVLASARILLSKAVKALALARIAAAVSATEHERERQETSGKSGTQRK